MKVRYRCGDAVGRRLENEGPVDYVRRARYEVERLEGVLEKHVTWYTHKNLYAADCPICSLCVVARGIVREFEEMLGPDATSGDRQPVPDHE